MADNGMSGSLAANGAEAVASGPALGQAAPDAAGLGSASEALGGAATASSPLGSQASQALGAGSDLAAGAAQAAVEVPSYGWSGYFMGLALMFLMLALLWYGARLIKRNGALRFFGMTPALNVESRLSIGPRKNLLVVRYRGKRLLLGVTEHNINLLTEDPLEAEEAGEISPGGRADETDADEAGAVKSMIRPASAQAGKFRDILNGLGKRN